MAMNVMVVGTLKQLSIVPEVWDFFRVWGRGHTRRIKNVLSFVYYDVQIFRIQEKVHHILGQKP